METIADDIVLVVWEDSLGCPQGWQRFEECEPSTVTIRSVGWILRETEEAITLCPHIGKVDGEENQGQGIMTIPKRCVLTRTAISS
jgi:hypothetical protein